MWTKLGSLRERVREHAKSAAQVAQGVLQAAAAEDDGDPMHPAQYSHPEQQPEPDGWDQWNQTSFEQDVPQPHLSPPPQSAPPPPAAPLAPPPLPDAPPQAPADDASTRGARRSRYVVTGIASSKPPPPALAPPVPTSFLTPAPPIIAHGDAIIAAEETPSAPHLPPQQPLPSETAPPATTPAETVLVETTLPQPPPSDAPPAVAPPPDTLPPDTIPPETAPPEAAPFESAPPDSSTLEAAPFESAPPDPTPPYTIPPDTTPSDTDFFTGTHVTQAPAEPQPPADPSESVSKGQRSPADTFWGPEKQLSQTFELTSVQPPEQTQPEAGEDAFIGWGDDSWNLEGDEAMGIHHAADEMPAEVSKPLAQEAGADVEWFSTDPHKEDNDSGTFAVGIPEPFESENTLGTGVVEADGDIDDNLGTQELSDDAKPQEQQTEDVTAVSSPHDQDSHLVEDEVPSDAGDNKESFQPELSSGGLQHEADTGHFPLPVQDEAQQPPVPQEEETFWIPENVLIPPSSANEPHAEVKQALDLNVLDKDEDNEPGFAEPQADGSQGQENETFPPNNETDEQNMRLAQELDALRAEIQRLTEEKSGAMAAKSEEERQNEELKRSVLLLKDDLERTQELTESLTREKELLLQDMENTIREKQDVETERDAAIERGGDGIREAHKLIEVMRGNESAAREREEMIAQQVQTMQSDVERLSSERNALQSERNDLDSQLELERSQAEMREEQLTQQLKIANHNREIAELEKEKALESIKCHTQEYASLYADERNRETALQEKDLKIQDLERALSNRERDKDEEDMRIELLSKQIQEMKDHTREIIEERNCFDQEKLRLENEIEAFKARHEQVIRELQDAKREGVTFKSERDEARSRCASIRDQNAELRKRFESLAGERDRLIQERTAAATGSNSVSEKEKSLAQECEQKTKSLALLQRKLTSLSNKIEKLTVQKGNFQRQRDEVSTRLRAAAEEFMTLHSKLESITNERDSLKTDVTRIREERDNANMKAHELSSAAAECVLLQDKLNAESAEVEELSTKLEGSRKEVAELLDKESTLKQKNVLLVNELSQLRGMAEVLKIEKDSLTSHNTALEQEKIELRQRTLQLEKDLLAAGKKAELLEADLTASKDISAVELSKLHTELLAEQKSRLEINSKLEALGTEITAYQKTVTDVYEKVRSSLQNASAVWESSSATSHTPLELPETPIEMQEPDPSQTIRIVSMHAELVSRLLDQVLTANHDHELTKQRLNDYDMQLSKQAEERESLQQAAERCVLLEEELANTRQKIQDVFTEETRMRQEFDELSDALATSRTREAELREELRVAQETSREEIERLSLASSGEVEHIRQELGKVTSGLGTMWSMIQKTLDVEQLETFTDDGGDIADQGVPNNIGVHVLRGTASLVAELSRTRNHLDESEQRCQSAEKEVERLAERAEIAEQERDAFRGSNERLERKAKNSRSEGLEEAKKHYEGVIMQMEDELEDLRHQLESMSDKADRSEKEAGELRALCSKLTSQLNNRTNELDEAEEKIVYLQDQATTLSEDLQEAHRRLQEHEEESAVAQREEVERLSTELKETSAELQRTAELCSKLQLTSDEAEAKAKECELLAETHRQAEENLRIAIEQLEAAQDSVVEQRTIELQRKLNEMGANLQEARERVTTVNVAENKLKIQDEEIKELRGAIGRLADERVELKLELEKSLSRLNHPDAGGQLVDRRVVRQLLVSYFRVGSVRRRDVLELMSRMLAFSESDNIAVGLKRRALIDRLGSLVQAPELDNASLPPIGTVSDKWIEFLMKETEEGEEQAKGW